MIKKFAILPALVLALLTGCNQRTGLPENVLNSATVAPTAIVLTSAIGNKPAESIKWLTMEQAAERMKKEPRKLVIDVYTDWCGWCKKMDKDTFTDPKVVAMVNKHFYAVKLDAEGKEPITLHGQTFNYNSKYRSHELAVALLNGQMSYPTTVYLDEEMKMLSPVPGYLDANNFYKILRYFGENHHKSMNFQEFEKSL